MKINSRENEVRTTLSIAECARRIKLVYKEQYDSEWLYLDAWGQLLAHEAVAESSPIIENTNKETQGNENVNGNESVNGARKQHVNMELAFYKKDVISKLSTCDYRTSPIIVSQHLGILFEEWPSKEDHWLYIAQKWNPRAILRTINKMLQRQESGQVTIKNPAAYFTILIRFRKRRRNIERESKFNIQKF